MSSNRVLVQSGIYEEFVQKLKETIEKEIKSGDGMEKGVTQVRRKNPLETTSQLQQ